MFIHQFTRCTLVVLAVGGLSILAQGQTRRRGSVRHTPREDVELSREITRDDDKLEFESEVTGPGGRSAEREGEIEKKEGHVEFEGEPRRARAGKEKSRVKRLAGPADERLLWRMLTGTMGRIALWREEPGRPAAAPRL